MKKAISGFLLFTLMLSIGNYAYAGSLMDMIKSRNLSIPTARVSKQQNASMPNQKDEWLVMVYIAGRNDLTTFAPLNVNQIESGLYTAVNSQAKLTPIKFVVAYSNMEYGSDFTGEEGMTAYLVQPDSDMNTMKSQNLFPMKGADSGNVRSLDYFVSRAVSQFPARKKALIIWNHGKGIEGIASDFVFNSQMEIRNLSKTLESLVKRMNSKFDVLAMDACLMQMASVAYEFKDYAKYIVASEQPIPGEGYNYEAIAQNAALNNLDAEDFSRLLVQTYSSKYSTRNYGFPTTLSSIRSSAMPALRSKINKWTTEIMKDRTFYKNFVNSAAYRRTPKMYQYYSSVDLTGLIDEINKVQNVSPAIVAAGNDLKNYINNSLFVENYSQNHDFSNGIAVYMPFCFDAQNNELYEKLFDDSCEYKTNAYEGLKFSRESAWDDFVRNIPTFYKEISNNN